MRRRNKSLIFNAVILESENYDRVNIFTLIVIKFILIFYLLISLFLFLMLSSRFPPPFLSTQFSSETQSCPTLCDPMDCSMPGFPVHHQHLELAQIHVHRVGDAIQPSHYSSSTSPPAFHLAHPASESFPKSQLVASGGPSIGVSASASVLPLNIQD